MQLIIQARLSSRSNPRMMKKSDAPALAGLVFNINLAVRPGKLGYRS